VVDALEAADNTTAGTVERGFMIIRRYECIGRVIKFDSKQKKKPVSYMHGNGDLRERWYVFSSCDS
jgi:hypothetical protein